MVGRKCVGSRLVSYSVKRLNYLLKKYRYSVISNSKPFDKNKMKIKNAIINEARLGLEKPLYHRRQAIDKTANHNAKDE